MRIIETLARRFGLAGTAGFLSGRSNAPSPSPRAAPAARLAASGSNRASADKLAIERYRYLLRSAPPEHIEQAHEEAFAQLTPAQRAELFRQISEQSPDETPNVSSPRALARAATRAELRSPGTAERILARIPALRGSRLGAGAITGATLLGTVGGLVAGSAAMAAFLPAAGVIDEATAGLGESAADAVEQAGDSIGALGEGTAGALGQAVEGVKGSVFDLFG